MLGGPRRSLRVVRVRHRARRTGLSPSRRRSILRIMAGARGSKSSVEEAPRSSGKVDVEYYEKELARLQVELVKQQEYIRAKGLRVVVVFEGRDAAGKGGAIQRITETLNPRAARIAALPSPTEREKGQWYFQRYVAHLPGTGEMVLFDRSWYNRAGVERVMGFCTDEEYVEFLRACPEFERMLVRSGIMLIKYWFSVSDTEQERRFQSRPKEPPPPREASPQGPQARHPTGQLFPPQDAQVAPPPTPPAAHGGAPFPGGEGGFARPHGPRGGAGGGGSRGVKEAPPPQRDPPPAGSGALRGPHPGGAEAPAAAQGQGQLRPAAHGEPEDHPGRRPLTSPGLTRPGSRAMVCSHGEGLARRSPPHRCPRREPFR